MIDISPNVPPRTRRIVNLAQIDHVSALKLYRHACRQTGTEPHPAAETLGLLELVLGMVQQLGRAYEVKTPLLPTALPTSLSYHSPEPGRLKARYEGRYKGGEGFLVPPDATCESCGLAPGSIYLESVGPYHSDSGIGEIWIRQHGPLARAHIGAGPDDDGQTRLLCGTCHTRYDAGHLVGSQTLTQLYRGTLDEERHFYRHGQLLRRANLYGWRGLQAGGTDYWTAHALAQVGPADPNYPEQLYHHFPWSGRETPQNQRAVAIAALERLKIRQVLTSQGQLLPLMQQVVARFDIAPTTGSPEHVGQAALIPYCGVPRTAAHTQLLFSAQR